MTKGRLTNRVAIVTGGGRGLGRAHALALAAEGAAVVVNDLGGDIAGRGEDRSPAREVVQAIEAAGGRAVASGHDVSDWSQAAALVDLAVTELGGLDILVNNAGILRDRLLANMSEEEWDAVVRVHLKGHAATSRHAMAWWRGQSKAGAKVEASIVHTTSLAGLVGSFGQANYAAAKLGILGLSRVCALEGARYGIRSNAVSPSAATRIETSLERAESGFDRWDPANVSPLVVWLSLPGCPATGQCFQMYGDRVELLTHAGIEAEFRSEGRWTLEGLDAVLRGRLKRPPALGEFVEGLPVHPA